ncbi:chorismate mutase [Hysterangium stoloniferum]|nr:chorismate mutase [Hysterangium stoloniferum]
MSQNFFLADDPLSLERIRSILIRLEDTIIFSLIERAQFAHNPKIYKPGAFKELKDAGFQGSWLEWFLKETETFHAKARRYTSPDEYPFTNNLPPPVLQPLDFPKILYDNSVNANARILEFYTNDIIPRITKQATESLTAAKRAKGIVRDGEADDDGNYGSAATIDVEVLQAISKRVHYGKFVSESKFLEKPSDFVPHILSMNREGLEKLITKPAVEKALLVRLTKKATFYGQDLGPDGQPVVDGGSTRIDAEGVKDLYEKYIIPLTKDVEVDYLLQRLDGLSKAEIEELAQK